MKRKSYFPLIFLVLTLIFILTFNKSSVEKIQGSGVSLLSGIWERVMEFKQSCIAFFKGQAAGVTHPEVSLIEREELDKLRLQTILLKQEMEHLQDLYRHEIELKTEILRVMENPSSHETLKPALERHINEMNRFLVPQVDALPAKIIYRSPSSWNSTLWLNVGEADNQDLGRTVVAKNSPVVLGNSLVGVVESVTLHQCRVRLITDSAITPSVRVRRQVDQSVWHLAKGELQGSGSPLWRSHGNVLKGIGFNYDFADEEGPARDLQNGRPLDGSHKLPEMPIIQEQDLLVTTGMDGVFPAGLHVAIVTKMKPLKEGDYFYELEAVPTAGNMDDLSLLFILPPIGLDIK